MRPARRLFLLQRRALRHLDNAAAESAHAIHLRDRDRLRVLTTLTLDLHNSMRGFLRAYFLSSATGARLATGSSVSTTTSLASTRDALTFAMNFVRQSRGPAPYREPTWHDEIIFLRLLQAAGCSNTAGCQAALSIGSKALPELTTIRNFYAHRGQETALKVRRMAGKYGYPSNANPSDLLLHRAARRPQSVLDDWIDDLRTIVSFMPA